MYCIKCGKQLEDSSAFCPACGNPVPPAAAQPPYPQQSYPYPYPPQGYPPPYPPQAYPRQARAAAPAAPVPKPRFAADMRGYWPLLLLPLFAYLILPIGQQYLYLALAHGGATNEAFVLVSGITVQILRAASSLAAAAMVYACFTRSAGFGALWLAPHYLYIFVAMLLISGAAFNAYTVVHALTLPALWGLALLFGRAGGKFPRAGAGRLAAAAGVVWLVNLLFSALTTAVSLWDYYEDDWGNLLSLLRQITLNPLNLSISLVFTVGGVFIFWGAYAKRRLAGK